MSVSAAEVAASWPPRPFMSVTASLGPVSFLTVATIDGRPHAITGGHDRSVRVWDLTSAEMLSGFRANDEPVLATAVHEAPDGQPILLTGAADGLLRAWYLNALLVVSATGVDDVFAGENTGAEDRLGRGSLTAHLIERLKQLTGSTRSPSAAAGDLTGSGIVHVDGRWGAGKTTFIELMLRSWESGEQPLVVRYDAWRQSAIAPGWWSLAAEIRRAIHRGRAGPTRWVMTVGGFLRRLVRSTSTWVALFAVAAVVLVGWLVAGSGKLPQQLRRRRRWSPRSPGCLPSRSSSPATCSGPPRCWAGSTSAPMTTPSAISAASSASCVAGSRDRVCRSGRPTG